MSDPDAMVISVMVISVLKQNQQKPRHATMKQRVITWVTPRQTSIHGNYVTRFCGTVQPRPFLRLSSTIPSKTATQKSKGVSRPSPEVQYLYFLLVGTRLGPGSITGLRALHLVASLTRNRWRHSL
jgi:hypothetical protein